VHNGTRISGCCITQQHLQQQVAAQRLVLLLRLLLHSWHLLLLHLLLVYRWHTNFLCCARCSSAASCCQVTQ
jgi:hypothetical protein